MKETLEPIPLQEIPPQVTTLNPDKTKSISAQQRFHRENLKQKLEAQQRLKVMKSYGEPEEALADQALVSLAHESTVEDEEALKALAHQKKQQRTKLVGALRSIVNFFKLG